MAGGYLLHNLLIFGRILRRIGLDVNPSRMLDLVRAFDQIDIRVKADFYHTARCLLVHRSEDIPVFNRAFDAFWRRQGAAYTLKGLRRSTDANSQRADAVDLIRREFISNEIDVEANGKEYRGFSPNELLHEKDFSHMTPDELNRVRRWMARMNWSLGQRKTRRLRAGSGHLVDLRRTLRQSLKHGGVVFEWVRLESKEKTRPLIVLADISGSMERYTHLILQFLFGISRGYKNVEGFVFSTRLTRITPYVKGKDIERALAEISKKVPDWSSGTRIGKALKEFNFVWGRRFLSRGAVILIISDGWDRGDNDLLIREMARLQRSSHRLIWLNPLLGSPGYEPRTRGMQSALSYVDDFLPVHNLKSLEQLADHLQRLPQRRPVRRQRRQAHSHQPGHRQAQV